MTDLQSSCRAMGDTDRITWSLGRGHLNMELLMSLVECPVCLDTLSPPITQCSLGHVVCGKCRRRIQTCHSCRQPLRPRINEFRNLALENIIAGNLFRCRFEGCNVNLHISTIQNHEKDCSHRPAIDSATTDMVVEHIWESTSAPAIETAPVIRGQSVFSWVSATGSEVPEGSLVAGYDGSMEVIVARGHFAGGLLPGKLVNASHYGMYVPWNGSEHYIHDYETLVVPANAVSWLPSDGGEVHEKAILGGTSEDGEPLYIGRCAHRDTLTVGKFHPSHEALYISYGGAEIGYSDFEILVLN